MQYQKHQVTYFGDGKFVSEFEYEPVGEVTNYQEFLDFLTEYACLNKHRTIPFQNVEFVDLGKTIEVRAQFRRGPFNENPIIFQFQSDPSKKIPTHQLLNAVIGCLSQSPFYFLRVENGKIIIDKMMESYYL